MSPLLLEKKNYPVNSHQVLHSLRHLGTPIYGFDPDIPINNVSNSGSRFPDALEHQ